MAEDPEREAFGRFLGQYAEIPPAELGFLLQQTRVRHLQPGEMFVRAGERVETFGFATTGFLMTVYETPEGRQFVQTFIRPGGLVGSYSSMLQATPSLMSVQALTDVVIVELPYAIVQQLYERHPVWDRVGRRIAEREFQQRERREHALLCLSPEERYRSLCCSDPKLADRVPQYLIAAYLGITPVSLSRIRTRLGLQRTDPNLE